jgi:hypothetical protein
MKKLFISSILLLISLGTRAKTLKPVHWNYAAKIRAQEAVIFLKATMDPGWHIYSQLIKESDQIKGLSFLNTLPI